MFKLFKCFYRDMHIFQEENFLSFWQFLNKISAF